MTYWSSIVEYIIVLSVIKPPCLLCQIDSSFSILKDLLVFYCRRPSRVLWQKTAFYFMAEDFWHSSCRRPPCHLLLKNAGFSFGPIRILVDLVWHLISGSFSSSQPPRILPSSLKKLKTKKPNVIHFTFIWLREFSRTESMKMKIILALLVANNNSRVAKVDKEEEAKKSKEEEITCK